MLQGTHVGHRIGTHRDDVRILAGFDRADILGAADQIGSVEVAARIACAGVIPNFTM